MSNKETIPNDGGSNENRARELEPRPFENTIVALDVDGVLVKPVAYRQATRSTITFFAEQMGVDPGGFMVDDRNRAPGRNMSHFEAAGIPDPWDVSAIIVSLMKLKRVGIDVPNGNALEAFQMNSSPQSHPPEVILRWLMEQYQEQIPDVMEDIAQTLSETRDPFRNEVTSIFQEYVLGKDTFEDTYGKPSQTGAEESLIRTRDQSLIDDNGRKEINRISQKGGMVVIYTGRPGLPPYDAQREDADGYAPEAELAVEKSRVKPIGIVSMGSMEWLARETKTTVESLTKPNPTQALATILSALRGRTDVGVLMDAYEWGQIGKVPEEVKPFIGDETNKLELVVVEDSPAGVRAFINARKILESKGVNVGLTGIGVHGASFEKHMAFMQLAREGDVEIDTNPSIAEGIIRYSYDIQSREENGGLGVTI